MPPAPPSAIGSKRRVSNWGTAVRQSCLVGLFVWRGREGGGGGAPRAGGKKGNLSPPTQARPRTLLPGELFQAPTFLLVRNL